MRLGCGLCGALASRAARAFRAGPQAFFRQLLFIKSGSKRSHLSHCDPGLHLDDLPVGNVHLTGPPRPRSRPRGKCRGRCRRAGSSSLPGPSGYCRCSAASGIAGEPGFAQAPPGKFLENGHFPGSGRESSRQVRQSPLRSSPDPAGSDIFGRFQLRSVRRENPWPRI